MVRRKRAWPTTDDLRVGPVLEVDRVRKCFGAVTALDGVSLSVGSGEIVCVLGRNGAGKSTLVSAICGLLRPDSGRTIVCGHPVRPWDDRLRAFIGVAGQETAVYPPLTVEATLKCVGRMHDLRGADLRHRVDDVSEALDLVDLLRTRVQTLSGGQRRRLHTALALINRPRLVILDEPTAGVDVQTRNRLLQVVRQLASEGTAVFYSTHYLQEAEALDGQVAILDAGRVIASGPCSELLAEHSSSFAELTFAGRVPVIEWDGQSATPTGDAKLRVACREPGTAIPALISQAAAQQCTVDAIEIIRPSLEGVFMSLTGERYATASGAAA